MAQEVGELTEFARMLLEISNRKSMPKRMSRDRDAVDTGLIRQPRDHRLHTPDCQRGARLPRNTTV